MNDIRDWYLEGTYFLIPLHEYNKKPMGWFELECTKEAAKE
jgi:hypothetical protein